MNHMPWHLEAKVSLLVLLFFFSLKTILIRALLSTSNINSFVRKLLDSKNGHATKHMIF